MDSKDWETVGQMHMALGNFIRMNGGNPGMTYAAAEDAFYQAKELTEEGTKEHERLKALQHNAQLNGRGKRR